MRLTFFYVSLLFLISCANPRFATNEMGMAILKNRQFNPERNEWITPMFLQDMKLWFLDSMSIFERQKVWVNTDTSGAETWRAETIGYTFVDFRTKTCYDYKHLSDTASLITTHTKADSMWMFFGKPRILRGQVPLSDTVMDGVNYGRFNHYSISGNDTTLIETVYFLPEEMRSVGYYAKAIVNGKRASVMRLDDLDVKSGIKTYVAINIISNKLTDQEQKVFVAWKKNAAKHQLKK